MRPFNTFRDKRLGQRVDYDWVYWYQCVDFAKFYIDTCLWLGKVWRLGNAKDTPNAPFFADWEKIWGTNDLMQWDIIVKTRWKYWHIAIIDRIVWDKIYVLLLQVPLLSKRLMQDRRGILLIFMIWCWGVKKFLITSKRKGDSLRKSS